MPKQKSIPAQLNLCRAECDRRGLSVRYVLKDEGISAKTEDRPGYQRLLDLVAERKIDALVTWKLDRLVRSMRHFVDFSGLLEASQVDLISLTEQIDTSSAFGRFNFRNIASVAELERELIGERARLGRYRMATDGRWPNRFAPLGYRLDEKHNLYIDRPEARIVQQIFSWYNQDVPLTEITHRLSKRGIIGRRGRTMNASTIRAMVRNAIYTGKPTLMGIEHHRPDLRIIHDKTLEKALGRTGRRCRDGKEDSRRTAAMENVFHDYMEYLDALASVDQEA
jgi:site-specific DNA recombinase